MESLHGWRNNVHIIYISAYEYIWCVWVNTTNYWMNGNYRWIPFCIWLCCVYLNEVCVYRQFTLIVIREFFTNISYKLRSENSFQAVLKSYYHRTYSKQYLQTIVIEIIPNNFYKLLLSENWLQTIVTKYCQIIHYKQ